MRYAVLLAPLLAAGCALSAEDRRAIIEQAGEVAGARAAELAYAKAVDAGLDEEEARKLAEYARDKARDAGSRLAERAIPKVEDARRSKFGAALASVLMFALQLVASASKKGLPAEARKEATAMSTTAKAGGAA